MAPRSIALTAEEDRLVEELVRSGRFRDADEVFREGLRLVAEDDEGSFGYTDAELKAAVQVGSDNMAADRYTTFADAPSLRAHFEALAEEILSGEDVS